MHRRTLDLVLGVPAFLFACPAIVFLALMVKVESPGPAFFAHERVGRGRQRIKVLKLRTMIDGAQTRGPQVTAAGDPRITRLGRFLRATKLDELPQLWNVIRGDMSIVGPRPEAERYVVHYRPEWEAVFSVRPGITDAASIVFRNEESLLAEAKDRERAYIAVLLPAKIRLSLNGLSHTRARDDLRVVLQTVFAMLGRVDDGAVRNLDQVRRAVQALNTTT